MASSRSTLPAFDLTPLGNPDLPLDSSGDSRGDGYAPEHAPNVARRYALLTGNLAEIRAEAILLPECGKLDGRLPAQIETSAIETTYSTTIQVVKQKIQSRSEENWVKPIAQAVRSLRKGLGYTQRQLADAVSVSQGNVAKWEKGDLTPPGKVCVLLARLASEDQFDWWMMQAGVSPTLIQRAAGSTSRMVPLLRDAAAAGTPRAIDDKEVEEMLSFPRRWLPHGGSIFAIKVSGDSMSPLLEDGYIALIDVSSRSPEKLMDRMIAAREDDGVTLKWFRKQEHMYLLVPQNTSQRHPIRVWTTSDHHAIVGEVVSWIGHPPITRKSK